MPRRNGDRPVIGVTGPDRGGFAAWIATRIAVRLAGGTAVRMTPSRDNDVDALGALIIGGGADVGLLPDEMPPEPAADERSWWQTRLKDMLLFPLLWLARSLFGKHQRESERARRDELEFDCLRRARARDLPVLGICRGAQLINVALGGRLYRDLASFYEESPAIRSVLPRKSVTISGGTRLAEIIGRSHCHVNALHRQAIDGNQLGSGLRVAARESTGVVQAIEAIDRDPFLIGVQWHPEYVPQRTEHRRLFGALVAAARLSGSPTGK